MRDFSDRSVRDGAGVATRVNWLGNRLVTTASATYGQIGLGFLDARLLYLLGRRGDLTAARIAEMLGVDAAAVSRAVKSLKARELIVQASGPLRSLSLTEEGRGLYRLTEKISNEREARLLHGFTDAEAEQILEGLNRLLANMDQVALLADQVPTLLDSPDEQSLSGLHEPGAPACQRGLGLELIPGLEDPVHRDHA
jgi:DNA-binding MarR family transcriptional regulator